jgi:hypothetical protein
MNMPTLEDVYEDFYDYWYTMYSMTAIDAAVAFLDEHGHNHLQAQDLAEFEY